MIIEQTSAYEDETLLEYENADQAQDEQVVVQVCVEEIRDEVVTVPTVPQYLDAYTVVLTSDQPVAELLPQDPLRRSARLYAVDTDVVLCHSRAQALDPANQVAMLPSPNGAILPTSLGYVDLDVIGQVWVAAPVSETDVHISVIATRRSS